VHPCAGDLQRVKVLDQNKRFDISGQRFGRLVAKKCVSGKNSKGVWECICDCGRVKNVSYHSLTMNQTRSCGCSRKQKRAKDITGQRFGMLTAIERTGEKRYGCNLWRCKCDCGKETAVVTSALISGNTRSCGCLADQGKRSRYRDISGQRFGKLVAIEPTELRSGNSIVWKCQCDCGKVSNHSSNALLNGQAKSCGCSRYELRRSAKDGSAARNTSGVRGVRVFRNQWQASISYRRKTYHLGTFSDMEEAVRVRTEAEKHIGEGFDAWFAENIRKK